MGLEAMLSLEGLLKYHTCTSFLALRQLGSDAFSRWLVKLSHIYIRQAAAAAQVRTYRDNGVKHSNSSYNRVGRFDFRQMD